MISLLKSFGNEVLGVKVLYPALYNIEIESRIGSATNLLLIGRCEWVYKELSFCQLLLFIYVIKLLFLKIKWQILVYTFSIFFVKIIVIITEQVYLIYLEPCQTYNFFPLAYAVSWVLNIMWLDVQAIRNCVIFSKFCF